MKTNTETSFKVSKKTKYIQIDYVTELDYVPSHYHKYVWCLSVPKARTFVKRVQEIEANIIKLLATQELSYDYRLIMYLHLNAIENISCGFDIRSDMSSLELAERFVGGYDHKYKEAYTFCKDTLDHVETTGKFDSYMKDWRRHDKHNDLVREFNLPFKKLELEDFRVDELKNMSEALEAMHKLIDEDNERKKLKNQ
jgi:hypothetical protein